MAFITSQSHRRGPRGERLPAATSKDHHDLFEQRSCFISDRRQCLDELLEAKTASPRGPVSKEDDLDGSGGEASYRG